ncbi:TPA: insulinase family protein [Candidatus Avigastranaerophilus faecigallinarum]|nr:insulinase family protein [Candidatus Avigastranaerophilus faecigallinarum]
MKRFILVIAFVFIGLVCNAADYSTFKLDNGHSVVIQEVHDNPIVIIDTWIKTGSINETDENNGVAHFLEHLFFKGTSKHPAKEFDQILESKGAITNAATSKDYTHYYILIPSQYFELALDLHSDMLLNPLIPRKELEKERKVVIEEISKNNDKPITVLYKNMVQGFYKLHPYKRDVIGTKQVIETISREQILDFYNTWYTPQNMTTVVIGDVDTQKALDLIKTKFNKPANITEKKSTLKYKLDKKPSSQIESKEEMNVETGYILIGFKGCHPMSNKDSYALDVLATILGEGKSSRLYKNIKEQKQLVHSISASHSSMRDDSIFYVSANYVTEDIERLKNAIFSEIEKLQKNEITNDEIQKAKNIIERDTFYSRESVSNIASAIGYTVTLTNDTSYYKNYLDNINKVTAEDLRRVSKEYLDIDSAVISVILPAKDGKPEVQKKSVKDYNAKILSQDKDTIKYELENGAVLIITQNTSNDIVAMEMSSKGGNNLEKIPGIATITAETMLKGTKKYKSQELSLLLEENGIRIAPSARGDSFGIAAKFTKNEKNLALDIFEEIATKASLDSYDIERVKADKMHSIKNKNNTPDSLAFDEFRTALWDGTPYGNTGKILQKTIPYIQTEDIVEFYNNLFPAENVVITINGNVDSQEYINYFSKLLRKTNKPKISLSDYKNKFKPLLKNKIVKVNKDSQAVWLLLGWLTDGVENQKDWATLQVIDSMLGSGMSSRLFTQLRDEQGLAYQVGSSFSANVNKGVFALYIATNPKNVQVAKAGLFNEIEKLKKEFVTEKELSEAKDKLLGNYVLSMETNMDKASIVNSIEISGRDFTFLNKYPQLINEITVQDVIKTANKYFSKPYVFTMVGPIKSIEKL